VTWTERCVKFHLHAVLYGSCSGLERKLKLQRETLEVSNKNYYLKENLRLFIYIAILAKWLKQHKHNPHETTSCFVCRLRQQIAELCVHYVFYGCDWTSREREQSQKYKEWLYSVQTEVVMTLLSP
jgi:hypothetical protein